MQWNQCRTLCAKSLALMVAGVILAAGTAHADSHALITGNRSGASTYVYYQQGLDSEFGRYRLTDDEGSTNTEAWLGTELSSSVGTEMWKFLQLETGYGAVNLHKSSDKLARLSGSRLHAGMRLDFTAPLFNLELGGGLQASSLDYINHEETSTFYGTGTYFNLGINYFMTTHLSIYTQIKYSTEHMKNTGGAGRIDHIDSNATAGGLGFRIWF